MEHEYCGSWESAVVVAFIKVNSGLLHSISRPSPWPHGAYSWVGLRALFSCVTGVFYFLRLLKERSWDSKGTWVLKETVLCRPRRRMSCFLRRTGKWGMRGGSKTPEYCAVPQAPLLDATFPGMLPNKERLVRVCLLWTLHRAWAFVPWVLRAEWRGSSADAGQRQWEWGLTRCG